MGCRCAYAIRQSFHALANRYNERAIHGLTIDPLALCILRLQAQLVACLQKITRQHTVLVWTDALPLNLPLLPLTIRRCGRQVRYLDLRVLDNLEFVLLIMVEESAKGIGRQSNRLGDEAGEERGNVCHALHVVLIHRPKVGKVPGRGPLVGCEKVVVEGCVGTWDRVGG